MLIPERDEVWKYCGRGMPDFDEDVRRLTLFGSNARLDTY